VPVDEPVWVAMSAVVAVHDEHAPNTAVKPARATRGYLIPRSPGRGMHLRMANDRFPSLQRALHSALRDIIHSWMETTARAWS